VRATLTGRARGRRRHNLPRRLHRRHPGGLDARQLRTWLYVCLLVGTVGRRTLALPSSVTGRRLTPSVLPCRSCVQTCWVEGAVGVSCNYACSDLWLDCSHDLAPLGRHEASLLFSQLGVSCDQVARVEDEQPGDADLAPFLQVPVWDSPSTGSRFSGAGVHPPPLRPAPAPLSFALLWYLRVCLRTHARTRGA
jgi:hypothetical protein